IYAMFVSWIRNHRGGSFWLLAAIFLWGCLPAACFSLVAQATLDYPLAAAFHVTGFPFHLTPYVVTAPLTEELFKGMAVFAVFTARRREFDGPFDGVIYGTMVGLGFAVIENLLYYLDTDAFVLVVRTYAFGLSHAFFTSLTGIGFGIASHALNAFERYAAPLIGLAGAMLAHALHNLIVWLSIEEPSMFWLAVAADWAGVAFVILVMSLAVVRARRERPVPPDGL
ncbi:MAG TPA: PrsW family intramembrane metalloprotease, partial [Chloroflexi bacterium]|nr:PrsW family intramembrane metalloprotease [Chloroflexota bacterium]